MVAPVAVGGEASGSSSAAAPARGSPPATARPDTRFSIARTMGVSVISRQYASRGRSDDTSITASYTADLKTFDPSPAPSPTRSTPACTRTRHCRHHRSVIHGGALANSAGVSTPFVSTHARLLPSSSVNCPRAATIAAAFSFPTPGTMAPPPAPLPAPA